MSLKRASNNVVATIEKKRSRNDLVAYTNRDKELMEAVELTIHPYILELYLSGIVSRVFEGARICWRQ